MDLKGKLERACKLVLLASAELPAELQEQANAPSRIYMGADHEEQKRPCVVCWCQGGEEDPMGSGNRFARLTVLVKSIADQSSPDALTKSEAVHNARVRAVLGIIKVDNLAALLSGTEEDVTVYDPSFETGYDPDLANRSFVDGITFTCYACPSRID